MATGQANGAEPVVDLVAVVSAVGGFPVLTGVDLTVKAGEIVLIHGENGAGKSSLLALCAGLLPVTRGAGTVCGYDLATDAHNVGRQVGLLGHRNGLYLDLDANENLRFWSRATGASNDEARLALHRVGITGRVADTPARLMSAGQRRRTALACLIMRRARLWLLDEPHAGLDSNARDELDELLRQAADAGATVMIASHELERAANLSQRSITVSAGRTIEDDEINNEGTDREAGDSEGTAGGSTDAGIRAVRAQPGQPVDGDRGRG